MRIAGYISQKLWQELWSNGLKLITPFKKNMSNKLLSLEEKLMLRKRSLIETVNDQLKNISQLAHSRHRSVGNFMVNVNCCFNSLYLATQKTFFKIGRS
jgi:hypothetical protein